MNKDKIKARLKLLQERYNFMDDDTRYFELDLIKAYEEKCERVVELEKAVEIITQDYCKLALDVCGVSND